MEIQKKAKELRKLNQDDFKKTEDTKIYWLGNGGAMINSRGTCLFIDPLLKGFDMPLLCEAPISAEEVPNLDAVLITHCDNDHFSKVTCHELEGVCKEFHSTHYVASLFEEENIMATGHDINESFMVDDVKVTLTPAWHNWQNEHAKYATRHYELEDYCGFYLQTKDGSIWMPGDSRLIEEQLHFSEPDVILLDFSKSSWHIGEEGVKKLTAAYPNSFLIPIHWGCVDAPKWAEFNGDPEWLREAIVNPERVCELALGEGYSLKRN